MQKLLTEIDLLRKKIQELYPLSDHMLQQLKEYYRIGLTYSSNALEGNSLTESETKIAIEDGLTVGGKPLRDYFEAIGHSEAYDFMFTLIKGDVISQEDIKTLHRFFYKRIDETNAGTYRNEKVFISGSKYSCPNPEQVPILMKQLVDRLPQLKKTNHPVEYAALVHKEFVFIHPFVDGNGRVARLLMNTALLQAGYCIAIIPPILRAQYIQALEDAHANDASFKELIAQQVKEACKDYLRLIE
ncbi:Fic family protein [Candidatus Dependentiae bacterium]|nr:Fic family protein [Candidatus Dependentiae bacterium]